MALFKRVEETKTAIKVLAYGASGTGKTTFSLSFPSVVAIDTESGMSFYKGNPNLKYILETTSAEEVEEAMEEIEDELIGEVATLVIDSETKIYENQQHGALELVEKRARKKSQNVEDANISQREWGKIKLVSKRMQSAKIKLSSMGVSIVSIAQMKEIKEKKGETFVTVGYAPDCGKGIEYDYDVVLRLFTEKDKVTGLDVYKAEVMKDRTGSRQKGEIIINPSYEYWRSVVEGKANLKEDIIDFAKDIAKDEDSMKAEVEKAEELVEELKTLIKSATDKASIKKKLDELKIDIKNLATTEPKLLVEAIRFIKSL